ncbi:hypothetical protein [Sphingomonas jatrophae]|uniref:Uncharacterized protein n=1 Tax=Sphingomonas jatrophae TaxID=1166337 RepID=A0A1I6M7G6_9SPHN|nr:hypothetical protein [Sphingomonas jatrophae]SFS11558.1 hypothetical protein SAMN05192580_3602 [Sphingomonas jatrophae]
MIEDEIRLLDNSSLVEDDSEVALAHLRALHQALGELIRLARAD